MSSPAGLEQALAHKRAGRLDDAVIAIEAVLSRAPTSPLALAQLADVQARRGRPAEAEAALDRAEELGGTTGFTARLRGDLAYKAGRWQEAARAYRDADALGAGDTWCLVQRARCLLRLGDVEGARGAAAQAAERDQRSSAAWTMLAEVAVKAGPLEEAEAMLERATTCAPGDEWAYAKLVEVRLLRLPEAERQRQVQVLLKSSAQGNRHLVGVLGRLRSQAGEHDKAVEAWDERLARHPGDSYARRMQAFALRKAGRLDEAATSLRACLTEEPDNLIVFRTYVRTERDRGDLDALRRTLEELAPRATSRRGAFYGELRKLDPAT